MGNSNTLIRDKKFVKSGAVIICCTILLICAEIAAYAFSGNVQSAFTNQVVDYEKYRIHFIGYYAEETTGNLLAEFLITDADDGMLTEDFYINFQKVIDEAALVIQPENEFNGSMDVYLSKDSEGNAILSERIMVTAGQQSIELNNFRSLIVKDTLIEQENIVIGKFDIPEMAQTLDSVDFDVIGSDLVKQVTVSGLGMQIVFDDVYAKAQFEQALEASGIKEQPDYDPEEHDYEYFKDMTLYMKNGTENRISDNYSGTDFANGTYSPTDDGNAYWSFAFKNIIDVNEIEYLEIDGVQYYPQSSS